jgi:methylated-DNA-protein-cysteine methyltransferase-like protein
MEASDAEFAGPDWHEAVYTVVRAVPKGSVVTYGQVAELVDGVSVTARQVGTAMRFAPEGVPWHRVVGAGGRLPIAKRGPELPLLQRRLLEREGVRFLGEGAARIDMAGAQLASAANLRLGR